MNYENTKLTKTPVALDAEIKDWLKHKAIDNKRTLQQEIAVRLQQSRKAEEAKHEKQSVSTLISTPNQHSQEGA